MFKTILTFLIICIVAVTIFGIVQLGVDKSVDKICNDYAKSYQTCIKETK